MDMTSAMKLTTHHRRQKVSQPSRNANKRVLRIFTAIVFMGTFAMGILMNYVTKEDVDKLVGFDVEEIAFGFLPDDIHLSLISNTTRINLRKLILGKPRTKKRKWLNLTDAPVPDGMKSIQLTLSWENVSFEVGSFVDEDVKHIYFPHVVHIRPSKNMDYFWADLNETRSMYTDPLIEPSNSTTKVNLPFEPSIQYLGVLLDAGRSYFTLDWIRNLLDLLAQMNYNLVHFRLTDDQAFNVRLDCHPELAHAAWNAPTNTTVYTPDELRALVQYASERGIILMPEINVPGHAGGWAGNAPGLVVPCAPFVCHHGYGLPLNISHVGLYDMIESIIIEVMGIFSTSPFIHLGGDEVEMAEPCFTDVGQDMMDYNVFEERLEEILEALQIPQTRVVRWEMTGQKDVRNRVGKIPHYWFSTNYMGEPQQYIVEGEPAKDPLKRELDDNPNMTKVAPLFVSQGLYFDTNEMQSGWAIYQNSKRLVADPVYEPVAVIAGTFELDSEFWFDRNIVGRLLAVAMGASNMTFGMDNFTEFYFYYCRSIDLPESMCRQYGVPIVEELLYKRRWMNITQGWKYNLCDRLTESVVKPEIMATHHSRQITLMAAKGTDTFWSSFGKDRQHTQLTLDAAPHSSTAAVFQRRAVQYTGIIVDLVALGSCSRKQINGLKAIIETMARLGMNLLQLRIMNDYGFAMGSTNISEHHTSVAWTSYEQVRGFRPYNSTVLRNLVDYAFHRGIEVVPEISLATRAGGWFKTSVLMPCPVAICERGHGLTTNVTNPMFTAVVFSVIHELKSIFNTTQYIHLGYDERQEAKRCNAEAKETPDIAKFEKRLEFLLNQLKIPLDNVIRWENTEGQVYSDRAGKITHYRGNTPDPSLLEPYFISTNLVMEDPDSSLKDAWDLYKYTRKMAQAKPTAILAWVGGADDATWDLNNVYSRLMAVAFGTSEDAYPDIESFNATYSVTCAKEMLQEVCHKFGRQSHQELVKNVLLKKRRQRLEESCNSRTRPISRLVPKEGFALHDSHDEL